MRRALVRVRREESGRGTRVRREERRGRRERVGGRRVERDGWRGRMERREGSVLERWLGGMKVA